MRPAPTRRTARGPGRAFRDGVAVLAASFVVATTACMPWVLGEDADTVAPGRVRLDGGAALLAPPTEPHRVLPVPQARVVAGLATGVDAAVAYAPPLTGHARLRLRLHDGPGLSIAASAGWGVHGIPDMVGAGKVLAVPFATGELQVSDGARSRLYGGLRAIVPYHAGEPWAATLWLVPRAGMELGTGSFRWGPELGIVVPTMHPTDAQLVLGVAGRWSPGQ